MESPQLGRPNPFSGRAAQRAIRWFWKHSLGEIRALYGYTVYPISSRKKASCGVPAGWDSYPGAIAIWAIVGCSMGNVGPTHEIAPCPASWSACSTRDQEGVAAFAGA
ncbi:hypothetical protein Rmet_6730 (plasmid) [Cupriavidus metallidurans CH34]|uniref:Uncharacterized protein n=1 Tax=Cupriavidus metallidurans (strain ATCC 43123 / DSM 2839 / NBRC 102507 / CH34) TaxID=266264 RepID=D3DYD9_CUPMC|nr:hypothetical protein Rmet_6730 [Cupriavidus metallidurans CH34]